jgi:hypothetical protein
MDDKRSKEFKMKLRQRLGSSKRRSVLAATFFVVVVVCYVLLNRGPSTVPQTSEREVVLVSSIIQRSTDSPIRVLASSRHIASTPDNAALQVLRAQSSDAVDDLLKCEAVDEPLGSGGTNDLRAFSVAQNAARYESCFHGSAGEVSPKFLYFGNHWGRHFNQMTSFVAALVLARTLNRTLIVPPLVFEKKRVHVHDLYDARRIYDNPLHPDGSPFCAVTEDEFNALERQRIKRETGLSDNGNIGDGAMAVDAACITMRGIKQHPQLPRGFTFKCVEEPFIKFKKNLTLFFETVGHSTSRLLTIPLAIYYAQALPEEVVRCPWRLIAPHPAIATAVAMLIASPAGSAGDKASPLVTIGVHLRALEGSCHSRQQQYNSHDNKAQGLEQQCTMTHAYVLQVAASALSSRYPHLVDSSNGQLVAGANVVSVVADDGQQPDRAAALAKALPHGVRTQQAISSSPMKQYLDQLRQGPAVAETSRGVQAPYNLAHHQFHTVPAALPILLDFWTLANVTVFVGNQVSTLSMNVCRYRRAVGLLCDNFV